MRLLHSCILLLLVFLPSGPFAGTKDQDLIDAVKSSRAAILEKGLPDRAIPEWLESTFQQGGKATWEVNDCGEGGDGRSAPLCVEMMIPQRNGYILHLSVIVADTAGRKIARPQLMMIYFHKADGYRTVDVVPVRTIAEAIRLYGTDLSVRTK